MFCALLALPSALTAAVNLTICNKGDVNVYVAIASKNSSSLLSPITTWRHIGWYETVPGKCASVYNDSSSEPAYVAFAYTDSTGRWGAAKFDPVDDAAMHTSTLRFCVARDKFDYLRSGSDPGGPCKDGYFKFPSAVYFAPRSSRVEYTLDIVVKKQDPSYPVDTDVAPTAEKPQDNTGMKLAAGILGAILIGAIVKELTDDPVCRSVPKPFEKGTLNARITGIPVVRRTCKEADWYFKDFALKKFLRTEGNPIDNLLDPPQQLFTASAQVDGAMEALHRMLSGGKGQIGITSYGKLTYTPGEIGTTTVSANIVALDLTRTTVGSEGNVSTLKIPCLRNSYCVVWDSRDKQEMGAVVGIRLFMYGQGTWREVLAELTTLQQIFPKPPVVEAR